MKSVGAFDAKTHFAALLASAEAGESFVITKHGRPVAKLVPLDEPRDDGKVKRAIEGLLEFGKAHPRGDLSIRQLIDEGRRL